jgi:hypothetical protein
MFYHAFADTSCPGVIIGKPQNIFKASDNGGAFVQLAIDFKHDVHDVFIGILAAWLYDKLKKGNKKQRRINSKQTILSKRSILRLIKKQLADQNRRDAQDPRDKDSESKKRR